MDADRPTADVRVERITEHFSGMALLRVVGWCDGDIASIEVRYDGATAIRCDDITRTAGRTEFGTQLPLEANTSIVEVVAQGDDTCEVLYQKRLADIGNEPPPPASGFASRTLHSITSGEVFSPSRWKARLSRTSEKLLALRQKVRNKLLARRFRPRSQHDAYVENTTVTPRLRAAMVEAITGFRHRPTFSILVPVYNVDPMWLRKAIESVTGQIYPHWELCLADDCSTEPELLAYLNRLPRDPRIKLVRRDKNGHICHATNSAAELAGGEFVCLLDNDDALAPNALFALAEHLQQHPDADLIYSDEDKIDAADHRFDPQFKPDWSPELLLSYNYVNHFTCIRRSVFEKAGRFRPGFEGSQDHDLLLRVTELTDRVQHVPQILYHWRALDSSTASSAGVKPIVHTSGRRAVGEALTRREIAASPYVPPFAQKLNLPVLSLDGPDTGPSVAVIIRGDATAARKTVRAIKQNTAYKNFTDYLVLDGATPAEALNRTAASRSEDLLLFLDAGIEPTDARWLSRLVANLQLRDVGAVGCVLRDVAGRITDAGPVLGMRDGTAPA
ncbi:MAG TPA: glycosyltransferase, partial [Gemmataceae bacterium]|nr:glycosyltransferase [Gemmataceae bacterium]